MSDKLLELIALELAHTRLKSSPVTAETSDNQLSLLEENIAQKQAELGLLPTRVKAQQLGVNVHFVFSDPSFGHKLSGLPIEVKWALEGKAWQSPEMANAILAAAQSEQSVVASYRLTKRWAGMGNEAKVSHFDDPEFKLS